ncbi:hypothetical protein VTL71DRAFT_3557 [Oculimacula yallundae]|uniref:NADH dehydrogenase subunit 3 n=1 Tax=Oculimacula yallundae TaxID=86028 RepID=A0ABR4C7H9_9HELO
MLETLPIVLIALCGVILAIGFASLMGIALKKKNTRSIADNGEDNDTIRCDQKVLTKLFARYVS